MKRNLFFLTCIFIMLVYSGCEKSEPSTIWGIVTDTGSGDPIKGATIILFIETEIITSKTTGQDGRYEFSDIASNYFYTLRAAKEGYYQIDTDKFYVRSNYSKKLDICLESIY